MFPLLLCAVRCPVTSQSALELPRAHFLNSSAISLQFPFMQRFVQVSEYENFSVVNAQAPTGVGAPEEPSGNCFLDADNALPGNGFEVFINACNFVEFRFKNSSGLSRVSENDEILYEKPIYYKIDGAEYHVNITKLVKIASENIHKMLYAERFEVELPWNACGIKSDKFLHSSKRCDVREVCSVHRKQKIQFVLDGSSPSEKITYGLVDCERSKVSQKELQVGFEEELTDFDDWNLYVHLVANDSAKVELTGPEIHSINATRVNGSSAFVPTPGAYEIQTVDQNLTLELKNGSRQYIKYEYKPGDIELPFKTKQGGVCDIVNKGIFEAAKKAYEDAQKPVEPEKPEEPGKPDPEDPNPPVPPEEPTEEPTCEEGQKLVDGECVDGIASIGTILGAIAGAAALFL